MRKRQARRIEVVNKEVEREDTWSNVLTGLGDIGRDTTENTTWKARAHLDYNTLDRLYAQNSLVAKIIDRPAWDMTREWISIELPNEDADSESRILERLEELEAQDRVKLGLTWGGLYGGAIAVIGAEDGASTDQPLNEAGLRRINKLEIFDRYQVTATGVVEDLKSPDFGMPEFYTINASGAVSTRKRLSALRVHYSRVIRFEGVVVPDRLRQETQGWNWSNLDRIFPDVRDFQASLRYLVNIMKEANIDVFQIGNLKELLRQNRKTEVEDRFRIISMCKSILGAVVIGAEETYERRAVVLTGVVELLREFKETLSAAADIPTTLLWGRSPAGLNATGESDIRQYYDRIKGEQRARLASPLRRLARLLAIESEGEVRKGLRPKVTFNPLWQMDDQQRAEIYSKVASADATNIEHGVLDPNEVAMSRFGDDRGEIKINEDLRREALEMLDLSKVAEGGDLDEDPAAAPELAPDPDAPAEPAANQALNGAQITSALAILDLVARRSLPRESGIAALIEFFNIDPARAERVMGAVGRTFFVEATAPALTEPPAPIEE